MALIYRLFLFLYQAAAEVVAMSDPKAKKWLKGQEGLLERIQSELKGEKGFIWFHAASLGEFEQGRPLIEKIKANHPNKKILLTFFSPSGYEVRKNYSGADYVFYLPFDTKSNVKAFLDIVQPSLAVFIKYEFWLNYFEELKARKVPLIMLSAVFRPSQVFFRWYGGGFKKALRAVTHFFVQDEQSAKLLSKSGYNNTTIIPDTRIDRVRQIASNANEIPSVSSFLRGEKAFIGGSIYEQENELLLKAYKEGLIKTKFILAPHKVDEKTIVKLVAAWGDKAILYSSLTQKGSGEGKQVLIIDTIGLLASLYRYGYVAFIGGGFGKGVHNTLEPAAHGLPVLFGPKHEKFKETNEMIASGAAFKIKDFQELRAVLQELNYADSLRKAAGNAKDYIQENTGGTEMVYQWLLKQGFLI